MDDHRPCKIAALPAISSRVAQPLPTVQQSSTQRHRTPCCEKQHGGWFWYRSLKRRFQSTNQNLSVTKARVGDARTASDQTGKTPTVEVIHTWSVGINVDSAKDKAEQTA
jgi:hypothetical protein